jgi:hypothetical protein
MVVVMVEGVMEAQEVGLAGSAPVREFQVREQSVAEAEVWVVEVRTLAVGLVASVVEFLEEPEMVVGFPAA